MTPKIDMLLFKWKEMIKMTNIKNEKISDKKIKNSNNNKDIIEALKEVDEMINNKEKYPRYTNRKDLKKALLSD